MLHIIMFYAPLGQELESIPKDVSHSRAHLQLLLKSCPIYKISTASNIRCILKFCHFDKISLRACVFTNRQFCP